MGLLPNLFLQISSTSATHRFVLLTGTPGDGKNSFLKMFSLLLGKYHYKIQFLDDYFSSSIIDEFYSVLYKGPFVIQANLFSCNERLLHTVSSKAASLKKQSSGQKKGFAHFFLTTNLSHPEIPHLTGVFRKAFRQIAITPEIENTSLDVKLIVECFTNFELMRSQMMILIRMFDDMYMGAGNKISRSQAIEIINHAVVLLKEDKSMLQEEAILQAFWKLFDRISKYELEFPVYKATKDLFPRLELKLIRALPEPGFLDSIQEYCDKNHLTWTESLRNSLVEVWEKIQAVKALILCGGYNTQKTMIRNFIGEMYMKDKKIIRAQFAIWHSLKVGL